MKYLNGRRNASADKASLGWFGRASVILTVAVLVGACDSSSEPSTTEALDTSATSAETTTTAAETTTSTEATTTTAAETTTSTEATTTTAAETSTTLPFPQEREELDHGGSTWALVLAGAADPEDPAIVTAEQAAADAGYSTGWTDCDEGAADALDMPGGTITTSVYFESREDAEAAAAAFDTRDVNGVVAEVRTMCLD